MKYKSIKQAAIILAILSLMAPIAYANHSNTANLYNLVKDREGLKPKVLKLGLNAYQWALAHGDVKNKDMLTIVDYTLPSKKKRLWVIDLKTGKVVMKLHVAQGKNSGVYKATRFSNKFGSDKSSLGIFATAKPYQGKHGLSLRLRGLEKGINNHAMKRAIVVHPAWYVSPKFLHNHGRLGRSWGCLSVNEKKSERLIKLIKKGSVVFAYGPAENHDPNVNGNA